MPDLLTVILLLLLAAFATSSYMRREQRRRDAIDVEEDKRTLSELDEIERDASRDRRP